MLEKKVLPVIISTLKRQRTHVHLYIHIPTHTRKHARTHKNSCFPVCLKTLHQKRTERRRTKITLFSLYSSSVSEAKWWLGTICLNGSLAEFRLGLPFPHTEKAYKRGRRRNRGVPERSPFQKKAEFRQWASSYRSLSHTVDLQVGSESSDQAGSAIPWEFSCSGRSTCHVWSGSSERSSSSVVSLPPNHSAVP